MGFDLGSVLTPSSNIEAQARRAAEQGKTERLNPKVHGSGFGSSVFSLFEPPGLRLLRQAHQRTANVYVALMASTSKTPNVYIGPHG